MHTESFDVLESLQQLLRISLLRLAEWALAYREGRLTGRGSLRIIQEATEAGQWIFESDLNDPRGFDNVIDYLSEHEPGIYGDLDPDYFRRKIREYCLNIVKGNPVTSLPGYREK